MIPELSDVVMDFPQGKLTRVGPLQLDKNPVLVVHGGYSNTRTCLPMAHFLLERGRAPYILEWRHREISRGNLSTFNFHDLALGESLGAIKALYELHRREVHWIGHSGGGLLFPLLLAERPAVDGYMKSATLMASQATHLHRENPPISLVVEGYNAASWFVGYFSAKVAKLGPCNEPFALMSQWLRWNRRREMSTLAGDDVYARLAEMKTPVFGLVGAGDTKVAPAIGCSALVNSFGGKKRSLVCGKENGFDEDFNHSRIFVSQPAARQVWPLVDDWIESNSATG